MQEVSAVVGALGRTDESVPMHTAAALLRQCGNDQASAAGLGRVCFTNPSHGLALNICRAVIHIAKFGKSLPTIFRFCLWSQRLGRGPRQFSFFHSSRAGPATKTRQRARARARHAIFQRTAAPERRANPLTCGFGWSLARRAGILPALIAGWQT